MLRVHRRWVSAVVLALAGWFSTLQAQTLQTLAGGRRTAEGPDAGWADGHSLDLAQFNTPLGCVVTGAGDLLVADYGNNAVRRLDLTRGVTSTEITNLVRPVGVATDAAGNIYVLSEGRGTIVQYDRFDARFLFPSNIVTGLSAPTAFAVVSRTNIYITELGGALKWFSGTSVLVLTTGLRQPHGVAVLNNGLIGVCDTGGHVVRFINPVNGAWMGAIGTGVPGFRDGLYTVAQFNQPWQLGQGPNGTLVVTDRLNHRVRLVAPDGTVSTLYGVDPALWEGPDLNAQPIILPGWFDGIGGQASTAEAREPAGVTVTGDGVVYTTEVFYHIIRKVAGAPLVGGGGGGGGLTNQVVLPPEVSRLEGYFPMGVDLPVVNPNRDPFLNGQVYYTTDGSEPGPDNPSSQLVTVTNQAGVIRWREGARDLSSLRVKAFQAGRASTTVSGVSVRTNTIGVPSDAGAGVGATVLLPMVANLRPGDVLRSLQLLVQVTPLGTAPALTAPVRALSVAPSDFVPLVSASTNLPITRTEHSGGAVRMVVAYIGTNAAFQVQNFATVALLALPVPPTARLGDQYRVAVLAPSGTSDGQQSRIELTNLPPATLTVRSLSYGVGDTSPGRWYNAGGFGDGRLENSDVNNAFYASLGVRLPPAFTDVFDAMDAFPEDTLDAVGGDGKIRFLDWQILLERSLGFRTNQWRRSWVDGVRVSTPANSSGSPIGPADPVESASSLRVSVFQPQAVVEAGVVEQARPGATVAVPVYVRASADRGVAGLQFRAAVQPESGAPSLAQPPQFVASPLVPPPVLADQLPPGELGAAWSLVVNPFYWPLTGHEQVGVLQFTVPASARAGQGYWVKFPQADGAPDMDHAYDFGTQAGYVAVASAAVVPTAFAVKVSWSGTLGVRYAVESTADLSGGSWNVETEVMAKRPGPLEFVDQEPRARAKFYRVRGLP